ncbi:MAG TPA: ATP-binding protein [Acidobacteriaceae bacterium]|jgi:signal transduction histidine kinase|nr:ATP-binding protein [Acidobacteriaceae bacterium]
MTTASTTPTLDPADPRAAFVPTSRTPIPELIEALKRVGPLQGMDDCEYEWLARHGEERLIPAGTSVFHEGDPSDTMSIVLRGEIHVRRERGGPAALFIGRTGQITGLLPFSRMKTYGGHGYVVADLWGLDYHRSSFPEMMRAMPSMTQRCVSVLLDRVREVTRLEQQTEKLNALGKLAGNLAHEMNNPASAAQRAASGLLDELRVYGHEKFRLGGLCLDTAHLALVRDWQDSIREQAKDVQPAPDQHAALEDDLQTWLRTHGVAETWKIAPELAELGVRAAQLDPLGEFLNAESLTVVLGQFASSVRAERIAEAMLDSTARIFDLIRAIKDYSYMDQAPIQEVDVRQGLENTLTMLQSRLAHVQIERRYAEDLPLIAAYGSELNQVWTALLENALDAMDNHGKITLAAQVSGELILIEVWDDGPGISPAIRDRIFEPFFTTKAPGRGLGLGLDTVQRIVRRHRGYVSVESKPGATCFQVRLPMEQLQAY